MNLFQSFVKTLMDIELPKPINEDWQALTEGMKKEILGAKSKEDALSQILLGKKTKKSKKK